MSVRFFGQYLLERGVITAEQLVDAVDYQERNNRRFGAYAVEYGLLTDADVGRIHAEQQRTDKRFGELAVELGLLQPAQVQEVLTKQQNDHVYIGQALVHRGYLDEDTLHRELDAFKADQLAYGPSDFVVPEGVAEPAAVRAAVDLSVKLMERVASVKTKAGQLRRAAAPEARYAAVSVGFDGSLPFRLGLNLDEGLARHIAGRMLDDDMAEEPAEVIVDASKEFLNIVGGNLAAKLHQQGRAVELSPPGEGLGDNGGDVIVVPATAPEGDFEVVITQG